jgi:hypothetical protein
MQVTLDLAHRHAAGVEAQNLVVEAVEVRLALGDQLRLEAAGAGVSEVLCTGFL